MSSIVDTRSLRFRVLLLAAVTIGMTLAVAAVSVKLLFERHIQRRIAAELETRFAEIAGSIALNQKGEIVFSRPLVDARYDEPLSGAYWQISMADTVLERSRSLWDETLPIPEPLSPDRPREVTAEDGADLYVLARPLEIGPESAGRELTLVTALDHREIEALSDAFGTELNMALLAIAAVLFAGAFRMSGWRPCGGCTRQSRMSEAGNGSVLTEISPPRSCRSPRIWTGSSIGTRHCWKRPGPEPERLLTASRRR